MNWQDYYAIAQSLRARSDWLFAQGEHQYASKGVWGTLRYASRALKARYGGANGNRSLEKGLYPGTAQQLGCSERSGFAMVIRKCVAQAFLQQQSARCPPG